jgi:hypothetical protein
MLQWRHSSHFIHVLLSTLFTSFRCGTQLLYTMYFPLPLYCCILFYIIFYLPFLQLVIVLIQCLILSCQLWKLEVCEWEELSVKKYMCYTLCV